MRFDTVVIGSGIAGLSAALRARTLGSVAVVTKAALAESNTRYAQGGIAAATAADDDPALHAADTIAAGAGLCDAAAVKALCAEGPAAIRELAELGVAFDRDGDEWARGREAAHGKHRVLHAGGDATGWHIEAALVAAVRERGITLFEHTMLTDLITCGDAVRGLHLLDAAGTRFSLHASAILLASGGAGQLYAHTTNPAVATGDGVAAAWRAGAVVGDLEFYQFHPTAAAVPGSFLISEAVRGDGAVLRNAAGERFMTAIDPRAELAPRDVVARATAFEMGRQDGQPVVLDATALGADQLAVRFPTIDRLCRAAGFDWSRETIPVTPAAHYWMGGVVTDTAGRTSMRNLYAVGEVANTGVHGANRLASNSLLEGVVFARRAVAQLGSDAPWPTFVSEALSAVPACALSRTELQNAMWDGAGLLRDASGLRVAAKAMRALPRGSEPLDRFDVVEDANLALLGSLVIHAADERRESVGAHYRSDHQATVGFPRRFYRSA